MQDSFSNQGKGMPARKRRIGIFLGMMAMAFLLVLSLIAIASILVFDDNAPQVEGTFHGDLRMDEVTGVWEYFPKNRGKYYLLIGRNNEAIQLRLFEGGVRMFRITKWSCSGSRPDIIVGPIKLQDYHDPWDREDKVDFDLILASSKKNGEIVLWTGRPEYDEYHRVNVLPPDLRSALKEYQKEMPEGFLRDLENGISKEQE